MWREIWREGKKGNVKKGRKRRNEKKSKLLGKIGKYIGREGA